MNKKINAINNFIGDSEENENQKIITGNKELIERIDKKVIVEDGRQLLRG